MAIRDGGLNPQIQSLVSLPSLGEPPKAATSAEYANGKVRRGEVPQMVSWYSPSLLSRIAIRDGLSRIMGELADKRQLMAATDSATTSEVINRYDYRTEDPPKPLEGTEMHAGGAFYVDYLSDTGDGFGSTYTMAYLLGAPALNVPGAGELPQGDTLLLGGDQCYPQGSREEYKNRFVTPFQWAFGSEKPRRKLFAIPGNHDWYDGLNAFDALFCAARDKLSNGVGEQIGGWQCMQHRSYWALRMPHNWWIWGVDIQFSKYLDLAQTNYFEAIAKEMGPDDRVVICIGEPSWMLGELEGKNDEVNLPRIISIVREQRARVVAVVAGDWHHYSHYAEPGIGVHFITAGGGGSFLHPTHVLSKSIAVSWPSIEEGSKAPKVDAPVAPGTHAVPTRKVQIKLSGKGIGPSVAESVRDVVDVALGPLDDRQARPIETRQQKVAVRGDGPKVYPSRTKSTLLSFKNIGFPWYNPGGAILIGFIYWLITWQFYPVAEAQNLLPLDLYALQTWDQFWRAYSQVPIAVVQASINSIPFGILMLALYIGLFMYVPAASKRGSVRFLKRFVLATPHFCAHIALMMALGLGIVRFNNGVFPYVADNVAWLWRTKSNEESTTGTIVKRSLEPLSKPVSNTRRPGEPMPQPLPQLPSDGGTAPQPLPQAAPQPLPQAAPQPLPQAAPRASQPSAPAAGGIQPARTEVRTSKQGLSPLDMRRIRDFVGVVLFPVLMVTIGGMLGGLILGLYWIIAGTIFRTHAEDAFAALRIRHYKNMLRFKFEPDKLTIYALGVDRVPGNSDWVMPDAASRNHKPHANNPSLVPKKQIGVRLIEQPIEIYRHKNF